MPFHVWQPERHPAAPVARVGGDVRVMIKTGIYGLVRALTFLVRFRRVGRVAADRRGVTSAVSASSSALPRTT